MKRLCFPLVAVLALSVAFSCDKEKNQGEDPDNPETKVEMTLTTGEATAYSVCANLQGSWSVETNIEDVIWWQFDYFFLYGTDNTLEGLISNGAQKDLDIMADNWQTGSKILYISDLTPDTQYYYTIMGQFRSTGGGENKYFYGEVKSFKTGEFKPTGGTVVNMGLSVKWASSNLGAQYGKPEEAGDAYSWGSTQKSTTFYESSYDGYSPSGGVLPLTRDAAYTELAAPGEPWRMPTYEEFDELLMGCILEEGTYNGVKGMLVTSEKNGHKLFFPFCGFKAEDGTGKVGSHGYYWTSTEASEKTKACFIDFPGPMLTLVCPKYWGLYIRPVYAE